MGGYKQHTSSGQQSDHPIPNTKVREPSQPHSLTRSKTHIKCLNRTIPHNIRPNPSHTAHNNMIINRNATRPESPTRLRVRVGSMIFKRDTRSATQRRLGYMRGIALVSTPVGGHYDGERAGCCGGGRCRALWRTILAVGVCRGGIVMDVIGIGVGLGCGEGLGIWVWGEGVRLRCRSGLLGCWLHPLDAVSDSSVGGLFGDNGIWLAFHVGVQCVWVWVWLGSGIVPMRWSFPPIMRGGKYKVLEGIGLFWMGLMRKDGSEFGGVVQAIRGETD